MLDRWWSVVSLSILAPVLLLTAGSAGAEEKTILGGIEDVILLPWRIKLPARVDTGAAKSSLDAREIKVHDEVIEFKLPEKYGGLQIHLPIMGWRHIRTPEGLERRPLVELEICLGSKRFRALVNLTDRSMVKYPLILGRNFLREKFLVDVNRKRIHPPNCPDHP